MDAPKLLREILNDAMEAKQYSIEKLTELSGVAAVFIKTLVVDMEEHCSPALPYAHGYIIKIARALDLNEKELWNTYVREFAPVGSGKQDEMPKNRFAMERVGTTKFIIIGIGIILFGILLFNSDQFIGSPQLTITNPLVTTTAVTTKTISIRGAIKNNKDAVTINNETMPVDDGGAFEKEVGLEPGTNTVIVRAKRLLGREHTEIFTIIYEPPPETPVKVEELKNKQ